MKNFSTLVYAGAALSCISVFGSAVNACAQEAIAIPVKQSSGQNYTLDFFAQYAPRTASDMVGRIPGFQISSSSSKRGLGNGGANILINGERISGKTSASTQLLRINAANVVRIEIIDGTSLDIPGLTGEVANIITKNTGLSGSWSWDPQFQDRLQPDYLNGSVTVSGEKGNLSYSARLRNHAFQFGGGGLEERFLVGGNLGGQTLIETRDEATEFYGQVPGIAISLSWKPKPDHTVNLNTAYNTYNSNSKSTSKHIAIIPTGDSDNNETVFSSAEDEWNAEIDGDYEFPAGPSRLGGKLKLIGYYRFEHSPTISRFDTFVPTGSPSRISGSRFLRVADEAEAIARAEYSWKPSKGRDWQIGLEGTFNYLDIASNFLLLNAASGDFVEILLDGATSRVEEIRTEATLTHSRTLSPKLDVQVSGGVEYSEVSQTGASNLASNRKRDFVRPKGFASATYKPNDSLKIRTRIEREVGQLSFFDIIASLSLEDNLANAANGDLVPEQSWFGSVEFDKSFGAGNTFKTKFYGELISDLVDRIPVGATGDAVGNIDSAHRYGVDFNATFKGDQWGANGTQVDLVLQLRQSSVDDPLTNIARRLNNDKKTFWSIKFRHDVPNTNWAYGADINQSRNAASYRLTTISQATEINPSLQAFIEHKDIFGLKVKGTLTNLLDQRDDFSREIYGARRDIGNLEIIEDRSRFAGMGARFNVSGTF